MKELVEIINGKRQSLDGPEMDMAAAVEVFIQKACPYQSSRSALLLALELMGEGDHTTKAALLVNAQPFTNEAMQSSRETPYAGWSAMDTLVRRGLVARVVRYRSYATTGQGQADQFSLTPDGRLWAAAARRQHEARSGQSVDEMMQGQPEGVKMRFPCNNLDRRNEAKRYLEKWPPRDLKREELDDGSWKVSAGCQSDTAKGKKMYSVVVALDASIKSLAQASELDRKVIKIHRCDCAFAADRSSRGQPCKHAWAVAFAVHRLEAAKESQWSRDSAISPQFCSKRFPNVTLQVCSQELRTS